MIKTFSHNFLVITGFGIGIVLTIWNLLLFTRDTVTTKCVQNIKEMILYTCGLPKTVFNIQDYNFQQEEYAKAEAYQTFK